jgi:hypothetical protein
MIAKILSSFGIYDRKGQENVIFTNPVTGADLDN